MPPSKPTGWRHWYHITLGTYGHWLPGDDRGWRERHHRRHVHGSLRTPPQPSKWAQGLHRYAGSRLKRPPFTFSPADFPTVGQHFMTSLRIQQVPVAAISVGDEHCHLLLRCDDDEPRTCAGHLKDHIYHRMFSGKPTPWQKRSHEEPIADLAHGQWAFDYILDHIHEGAWVWGFRERTPK